jgi:lysozyme
MKISTAGKEAIKKHEALRLKSYMDTSGVWTIGYGNTFYENGNKVKSGDVLTSDRANTLFENIVNKFANAVESLLSVRVTQNQFDSLVSLAYNIGINNFKKSSLLKKVNANPLDRSIKDSFEVWSKSAGKVSKGLINRRKAEVDNYFKSDKPAAPILIIIGFALLTFLIVK